jgi:hypothetical protein
MRRRRLLIGAGVLLAVVATAVAALALRERNDRLAKLARGRLIDRQHCDRVKPGMTRAEVEAVLGGPPGDFTTREVWFSAYGRPLDLLWEGDGATWTADRGRIQIGFDERGDVARVLFDEPLPLPPLPLAERVRDWLRRLWP